MIELCYSCISQRFQVIIVSLSLHSQQPSKPPTPPQHSLTPLGQFWQRTMVTVPGNLSADCPSSAAPRAQKALFDRWKMMVHHPDCGVISSFPEFPGVSACHSQSLCRLQWWFWSLQSLAWFSAESRQSSQVSSFPKMMILKLSHKIKTKTKCIIFGTFFRSDVIFFADKYRETPCESLKQEVPVSAKTGNI